MDIAQAWWNLLSTRLIGCISLFGRDGALRRPDAAARRPYLAQRTPSPGLRPPSPRRSEQINGGRFAWAGRGQGEGLLKSEMRASMERDTHFSLKFSQI